MGCQLCKPSLDPSEQASEQAIDVPKSTGNSTGASLPEMDSATIQKNKDFLRKVKLFQRLPKDQHEVLASVCVEETLPPGHRLIKQGDEGDAFYVIVSGTVTVDVDGAKVASLNSGDYLGENALLRDEPRNASITAEGQIVVLKITRAKFQEMKLADKLEFKHRVAVAGAGGGPTVTYPPSKKTSGDIEVMLKALKSNKNLTEIVDLDDTKCKSLIDIAWEETILSGRSVIEQGSDQADYFYIVKSGGFDVFVQKADQQSEQDALSEPAKVLTIPTGGSFGELALIFYAPRAATVKANTDSVVWVIDRGNFKSVLSAAAANKAKEM
jgi:CRP-like cAMP-binding protein